MSRDEHARALVADGAVVVDVRTLAEFEQGHVPGARNVPLDHLEDAISSFDDRPLVVYCGSGMRSRRATQILRSHGIENVHDMGGMARWEGGIDASRYALLLVLCLTLGLAPFVPEPHIVGKLRWIAGGGAGMSIVDIGDLLLHGAPWLLLLIVLTRDLWARIVR